VGFRDDRDAVSHRADALTRELDDAQSELRNEKLRSAEVDDLRRRLSEASKQRDELGRGVAPWRTGAWALLAVVTALSIAGGVLAYQRDAVREREVRGDRIELARLSHELSAAQGRLAEAEAASSRAGAELGTARVARERELRELEQQLLAAERERAGDVLVVTGQNAQGEICLLTIRPAGGETCLATLTCAGRVVFPLDDDPSEGVCRGADGEAWESVHAPLLSLRIGTPQSGIVLDAMALHLTRHRRPEMLRRLSASVLTLH
jgi:hypothetical protein